MFKSARWRSEKNKIKAVFKLQFHATQVAQVGIDGLMISVIPADVGKPTAKLEKVVVRDGSCYWENPVVETVKFDREAKSGKIHERIYRFVVATGSSKAGVVGEASIDFSNYAEATKVSSVSLPLKNSKSEILLHVSIRKLQESADQRQLEESECLKDNVQDKSLRAQLSNGDMDDGNIITNTMENGTFNKTVPQTGDLKLNSRTSSGSDVTMSSSECSSVLDTSAELQLKDTIDQDSSSLFSSLNHDSGPMRLPSNGSLETISDNLPNPKWGWLGGSVVDIGSDDSSSSPREAIQRIGSQEASDMVVENLRAELTALARQAEVSELELQTLRKQIVKESKRGQDLSKEVISLKEERDSLRVDCEKLKGFQKHLDEAKSKHMSQLDGGDLRAIIEELRQELHYEKDINANLRIQLQKTQESNSELLLAVGDLDEMLEQKNQEILHHSTKSGIDNTETHREENSKCETDDDDDEEQKALEQLVREHSDAKESYLMEQRIMDLNNEIEIYKRDKDELEVQMEQLALDYEILKQEHHDMTYKLEQGQMQERLKVQYECTTSYATVTELESQIEKLENKLKRQEQECSESLSTINELEQYVKDLEKELEKQAQGFEADLEALTRDKVEQEKRAIKAEEILRKTRWQNTNTAERLQGELRRLSMQMSSTFEANEKLATKAMMEASQLRLERDNLRDMLQNSGEELEFLKEHYEERLHELSNQVSLLSKRSGEMQTEINDKSMKLEIQEKLAEETHRLLSEDILMLKDDIDTLSEKNKFLSDEADKTERLAVELECMQKSIIEMEMLIEQGKKERVELENNAAIMKKESAQFLEEINNMRLLKDEKEWMLAKLQGQVHTLEAQSNKLRCSRSDDELEKEQLLKKVSQLKADLVKKEDALKGMEKLKDDDRKREASDVVRKIKKSTKSVPVPYGPNEIAQLKEKIRLLEGQIKQREAALDTSTNTFLEKEKELQNQIEDLAKALKVLNQKSTSFSEYNSEEVAEEKRSMYEYGIAAPKSNDSTYEIPKCYATNERNADELANEVVQLKEKNILMEEELKEMQERYSEISLKFAEVEGERQQLVMRVRNLKNAKKS